MNNSILINKTTVSVLHNRLLFRSVFCLIGEQRCTAWYEIQDGQQMFGVHVKLIYLVFYALWMLVSVFCRTKMHVKLGYYSQCDSIVVAQCGQSRRSTTTADQTERGWILAHDEDDAAALSHAVLHAVYSCCHATVILTRRKHAISLGQPTPSTDWPPADQRNSTRSGVVIRCKKQQDKSRNWHTTTWKLLVAAELNRI